MSSPSQKSLFYRKLDPECRIHPQMTHLFPPCPWGPFHCRRPFCLKLSHRISLLSRFEEQWLRIPRTPSTLLYFHRSKHLPSDPFATSTTYNERVFGNLYYVIIVPCEIVVGTLNSLLSTVILDRDSSSWLSIKEGLFLVLRLRGTVVSDSPIRTYKILNTLTYPSYFFLLIPKFTCQWGFCFVTLDSVF